MSLCKTIMSSQVSEGKQCTSTDKIFYRRVTVCYPFWTTNPNTLIYCSSLVLYELSKHCYDLSPATPVCSRLPLPHSSKSSQGRSKQPTITRFTQSVDIEVYTVVIVVQTSTTHRNVHCPHTARYTLSNMYITSTDNIYTVGVGRFYCRLKTTYDMLISRRGGAEIVLQTDIYRSEPSKLLYWSTDLKKGPVSEFHSSRKCIVQ